MDFYPEKPETHGRHIFINAHNSFWLGEFVIPDWDMFLTGHESAILRSSSSDCGRSYLCVRQK